MLVASVAPAATIVIDDFESGEGHFDRAPSFSGTTSGETETGLGTGPSTAERDITEAVAGIASQRIFMDDDPAADVSGVAWRLRHLSGGGAPAGNLSLTNAGYVGYWLKTTTPNLMASIFIDDGVALERALFLPIINDGAWHLYEWEMLNPEQWEAFAGTAPNGQLDAATVTIDGLYITAEQTFTGDRDAVFFIDNVSANPDGPIVIPEPSSLSLAVGIGLLGLGLRRCRRF